MKNVQIIIILFSVIFAAACRQGTKPQNTDMEKSMNHKNEETAKIAYQKGDLVPHNEVCMVNDAFMGKEQIEVIHDGKKYYGCCKMCEKRIPEEEAVRMAIDPVSKKLVDKSGAIIAITGDNGEVSYFENDESYKAFFKQ